MAIDWLVVAIVAAVVAGGLSYKTAIDAQKKAKKAADAMAGVLVNRESNIEPIPVIYGTRRVGGTRVFVHTEGGEKNQWLYIALVLCEGSVEDIYDIEIDDYKINEGRYGTIQTIESSDPNRVIYKTQQQSGQPDWVYIEAFKGDDDQPASDILSDAFSKWNTNHKLSGVAYLGIRLQWDQDVFSGMPEITAVVKGKKVYDPRSPSAPAAWSNNPALCIRDYLTNNRYGKGLPSAAINDTKFIKAANDCESFSVSPYSGATEDIDIFECNAVVDSGEELFANVERMLICCRGFLPYSNGQYGLVIDQAESAVMTLDSSNIIGGIAINGEEKKDKFNRVVVKFPNPETDWQPDQAIWPESGSTEETTFLDEDGGTLLIEEADLEYVTNYYAARDFARIFCLRSRNGLRCALKSTSEALNLVVGDVVNVTHPTPAWTAKPFQVDEMTLNYDGTVDINLIEYDSTLYPYDPASEEETYSDTDLPDPNTVAPPTDLNVVETSTIQDDGTVVPALLATWVAANDAFVTQYEVVVDDSSRSTSQSFYTSQTEMTIIVRLGGDYTVRVRSINSLGARSGFISFDVGTLNGDVTAPSIPTALTASGGYKQNIISWVNPTDTDFKHVEVHASATLNGTYSLIGVSSGDEFVHPINGFGITQYYKVRAFDFSSNASGFTSAVSATTEFVDSDAFTDEVTQLFSNANVKQIEIYASLPVSGEYVGQVIFLTSDNKLYRWTGSAWTASVPSVDITGTLTNAQIDSIDAAKLTSQIVGTQIQNGAISTAKIAAGAVSANEIAAGAVIADKIAANAITSAKIAAGTIVASDIAASTITGDKITANTITGGLLATAGIITSTAQINDGLIQNAKIENGAITTAKIGDLEVSTVKIAGNAITVPDFGQNGGTYNVTSAWQELVGLNITVSNVGASSRILVFGAISLSGGTNTNAAYDIAIFTGGTLHTSLGFRYGGSGVAVPIIGSYLLSDNTTNNPNLRIRVLNGSSTGVSIEAKIIAMAAKR